MKNSTVESFLNIVIILSAIVSIYCAYKTLKYSEELICIKEHRGELMKYCSEFR